jgi:PleD family two-component response regulator
MQILIMDRDRLSTQLLSSKLVEWGHDVVVEPARQDALKRIENEIFDVVLIDPAPLPSPRQIVLPIRRMNLPHYLYLILLTHNNDIDEVIRAGMNDYIAKPLNIEDAREKINNAKTIVSFDRKLRDQSKDIRTNGVVFGKRPFIHLFMAALDRANRYSEQSFLIFFHVSNYDELEQTVGAEKAQIATDQTAEFLSSLRRQSDFLARTDKHEFVLLMQRPGAASEPVDAANRYILALKEFEARHSLENIVIKFHIQLVELPMGNILIEDHIPN